MTLRHRPPVWGPASAAARASNFQQDLQFSDCIVIEGSNMAEAHPVGFQWVMEAKKRGATIIHVDPRFTRTSAVADLHVPFRAGGDIAFLGGLINYVLENELDFREYVATFTNAADLVADTFDDADVEGIFSGYDAENGAYDPAQLATGRGVPLPRGGPPGGLGAADAAQLGSGRPDRASRAPPRRDADPPAVRVSGPPAPLPRATPPRPCHRSAG